MSAHRLYKSRTSKPPVSGSRINWRNPLTRGLQCAFAMNENVGPPRCAITGPSSTTGTLNWTASPFGRAYLGTSSPVATVAVPFANTEMVGQTFTLAAWARVTVSGNAWFTTLTSTADNTPLIGLVHNPAGSATGVFEGFFRSNTSTWRVLSNYTTFPINDGVWRHFACVFTQASTFAFYIDGVRLTPLSTVGTWPVSGSSVVNRFGIASVVRTSNSSSDSAVDQPLWWNRPLSDGEIASLYLRPWQIYAPIRSGRRVGATAASTTYVLWPGYSAEALDVLTT